MAKRKKEDQNTYKYTISDIEAAYKIFMIEDLDKRAALQSSIKSNGRYCLSKKQKSSDTRCICKEFLLQDSEDVCPCGLYFKKRRTEKQARAFQNGEYAVNLKKERELEKKAIEEEKRNDSES